MAGHRGEPTSPGRSSPATSSRSRPSAPIAGFIGGSLIGTHPAVLGTYRVPFVTGLVAAIFTFGMAIVGVFMLSLDHQRAGADVRRQKNSTQALKVAVYSYTPAWIAGVLQIVPLLGILAIFARAVRPVSAVPRAAAPDEVPAGQGRRLHRGGGRLRDRPVGGTA